jgi:hypothetical protein
MRVSVSDVHAACDFINKQGMKPTYDRIRAHLGSGSYTTISTHLKTWRAAGEGDVPPPPEALEKQSFALTAALWPMAFAEARERHNVEMRDLQERCAQLEHGLKDAESDLRQAEERAEDYRKELALLKGRCEAAEARADAAEAARLRQEGQLEGYGKVVHQLQAQIVTLTGHAQAAE